MQEQIDFPLQPQLLLLGAGRLEASGGGRAHCSLCLCGDWLLSLRLTLLRLNYIVSSVLIIQATEIQLRDARGCRDSIKTSHIHHATTLPSMFLQLVQGAPCMLFFSAVILGTEWTQVFISAAFEHAGAGGSHAGLILDIGTGAGVFLQQHLTGTVSLAVSRGASMLKGN